MAQSEASPSDLQRPTAGLSVATVRRARATSTYVLSCIGFSVVLLVLGILNKEIPFARIVYVALMFALCAWPFLLGRDDARHRLVALFMGSYFLLFATGGLTLIIDGAASTMLWSGEALKVGGGDSLDPADFVILVGGMCFLAGYFLTIRVRGNRRSRFLVYEWNYGTVVKLGFGMWLVGFMFMVAYDTTVSTFYMPTTILGLPLSAASNLKFLSPLGALMIVYLFARGYRLGLVGTLLVIIIACEFSLGFVASSKDISFRVAVFLLLGLYFVRGRVNLKIVAAIVVISIPYMLYFNGYRMQIMEGGFRNPAEAFTEFSENLAIVEEKAEKEEEVTESSLKSLSGRIDHKVYIDIIVAGTDSGRVARLNGESLGYFFTSFVPRAFWPGKPQTTTGQMFNQSFGLSASRFTFVPTTQLGDLYWNFGWPAVILGMFAIGYIFARMAGAYLNETGMTLPRFLCLLLATYHLSVYFSANIATGFSNFVRLLIVIWLLDRLLRSLGVSRAPRKPQRPEREPGAPASSQRPPGEGRRPSAGASAAAAPARQ